MTEEHWKPAKGYESLYEVSNFGRVRSKRKNTRIEDKFGSIMRQKTDNHGYYRVNLYKDKKCVAYLVSRLVAETFIPNPGNLPFVGHDDDDKTNNHVSNLYWTDSKENNHHNGKMERFQESHRRKIGVIADKLSVAVVGTNNVTGEKIMFKSMQEASRHGFDSGKISHCVNGKRNTHKGYSWERIDSND